MFKSIMQQRTGLDLIL